MPAVINKYAVNKDVLAVDTVYESLLNAYIDDVEKQPLSVDEVKTKNGKTFRLINVPFYYFRDTYH